MSKKRTILVVLMLGLFGIAGVANASAITISYRQLTSSDTLSRLTGGWGTGTYASTHAFDSSEYRATFENTGGQETILFLMDFSSDVYYAHKVEIGISFTLLLAALCAQDMVGYQFKIYTVGYGVYTYSYDAEEPLPDMHSYTYNHNPRIERITVEMVVGKSVIASIWGGIDYLRITQYYPY
jgi:hypothetical protein